jgi:glucan phosphoethanolaminetransferase (alkaline phosphatase superfamily)
MNKIEVAGVVLALTGLLMKIAFLPFAGVLLTLGLGLLAVFYFLNSNVNFRIVPNVLSNESEGDSNYLYGHFVLRLGSWSLSSAIVGILFSIQFWPNAHFFLVIGLMSMILSVIIIQFKIRKDNPDAFSRLFRRLTFYILLMVIFLSIPKIKMFAFFHRNNPAYVAAVKDLWADPHNTYLKKEAERLRGSGNNDN